MRGTGIAGRGKPSGPGSLRHEKRAPEGPRLKKEKEKGGAAGGIPRARARDMRVERRPPVSGALLSHGLTPQYHRRSAA